MNEHEDTIASSLAQELADSIDEQFLVDTMYKNYKVVYGPVDWRITGDKIKVWVKEIMPHCLYHLPGRDSWYRSRHGVIGGDTKVTRSYRR